MVSGKDESVLDNSYKIVKVILNTQVKTTLPYVRNLETLKYII